jgi:tetratricopeptide (TPR) repeat protein
MSDDDIWAEIHWHFLKAAVARHDEPQVTKQLDELEKLQPTDAQIVIDIYPLLMQRGQKEAAQSAFMGAFADVQTQLQADPHNPMVLNSIAWLCAECGQQLPQAEAWAKEAVTAMPENSAILDTLAETEFRLGRPAEAVKLETHALELTPGDDFLTGQLNQFRAATTRPDAGAH